MGRDRGHWRKLPSSLWDMKKVDFGANRPTNLRSLTNLFLPILLRTRPQEIAYLQHFMLL